MSGTLRTLLSARAAAVVGRQAERAVLLGLAERDRPLVVAVHGIAGIGKSALLAAFTEDARARGAAVVSLDCGGIEPTERGFLAALGRAVGVLRALPPGATRPMATVADAADALSGLGDRVVLVLDTYEQLRLLDTWLRQELVPGLRDNTRLALAGREPPVTAWITDFGDMLTTVPLANLAAADADALLRREGLSEADAARITRFTHGHPLALRLAASARGTRPDLTVPDAAVATVVTELARVYLSGLDQPARAVLDAACTLRRPTLSLLAALLPDVAPHDAFDMLRPLPFVEFGPDGLVLHDTVREVVAALLRINDPPAYRAYRIAAWRQLRRELRAAPPGDLWRYTADLLYLIENPAVREAFFPTASHRYAVEPARPPTKPGSPRSPARTSQPGRSPSCGPGGTRCRRRSASRGTPTGPPLRSSACARRPPCRPGSSPGTRWPPPGASTCGPTRYRAASRCSFSGTCWPPTAAKPRRPRTPP